MKRLLFLLVCAFSLSSFAQAEDQQAGKSKIGLEEEEVTVLDNGKIVSHQYVSNKGVDKETALREANERIFKKIGVKNEMELKEKKLQVKYNEEREKILRIKKVFPPRLVFFDATGNIKKKIILGDKVDVSTNIDSAGKITRFKTSISRSVSVPKDQQYALVSEHYADSSTFPGSTGKVSLFDVNGNAIWEKQYPKFKIGGGIVSDDGSKMFLTEHWTENWKVLPENEPYGQFVAYDKTGKVLIAFPKLREKGSDYQINGDVVSSSNGRYVSVKADRHKRPVLLFFDIERASLWVFDEVETFVIDISDKGICRLGLYTGAKIETIDLKNGKFMSLK